LFFISLAGINAQTYSETDSLYLIALERYVVQLDSFYKKYSGDPSIYDVIYLEHTELIDSIPKSINGSEIIVLYSENWKRIYKQNNNHLVHLKIYPIKIEKGKIKITFIPYIGKLEKGKHLTLGLSSWTDVYFKFNCESQTWKYEKTKNGGI